MPLQYIYSPKAKSQHFNSYEIFFSTSGMGSARLIYGSTAQYFCKGSETTPHMPRVNSGENIFDKRCVYKYYLQFLLRKFFL